MNVKLAGCRHEWPENEGFNLDRPNGTPYYIFIHFKTAVSYAIDGKWQKLAPGACVFCPPYTWSTIKSENALIHDWMHLSGEVDSLLSEFGLECKKVYYVKDSAYLSRLVATLEREYNSAVPYRHEMITLKLRELCIHISREADATDAGEDIKAGMYEEFKRLRINMFANIAEDPSISDMAGDVHLSESRFYALYKQIFGISPKNDLITARIERAKSLLEQNKYTNAQIAAMTGYTNEYHFIRQFKKTEGITPKQYARAKSRSF